MGQPWTVRSAWEANKFSGLGEKWFGPVREALRIESSTEEESHRPRGEDRVLGTDEHGSEG